MANVVIVEDHEMVRDAIVKIFRESGHEVTACRDLTSAVEALHKMKKPADLLLTDWNYPGQQAHSRTGGMELLRHLNVVAETQPEQLPKNVVVMSDDIKRAKAGVKLSGFEQPMPRVFTKSELSGTSFKPLMDMLLQ